MKIVNVCLIGPFTDGWNYQDNLLTKYQAKEGNDVTIIAPKWIWNDKGKIEFYDNSDYINADGVRVIRLPMKGREDISYKFKKYIGLKEKLEELQPDVIFSHGCQFIDSSVIVNYVQNNRIKLYVDNHADFSNSATNWLSKYILHKIFWRHYAQKLLPYTECFYGVLPVRVGFLTEMYGIPKEKCKLLVMGADDELVEISNSVNIKNKVRTKYGIQADDFLIMTGGKIDLFKQQTLLLMDAVNRLNNQKVKLIVFGSVVDELKKAVQGKCTKNVQYIGWVQSIESYKFFASADLVVFPGRHSVFWEQVTGQGIPMVVKDWEGTHHIDLGGNVKFLKEDSVQEIMNIIHELVENQEEYNQMKRIAVEKGMKVFSYRDIANRSIRG